MKKLRKILTTGLAVLMLLGTIASSSALANTLTVTIEQPDTVMRRVTTRFNRQSPRFSLFASVYAECSRGRTIADEWAQVRDASGNVSVQTRWANTSGWHWRSMRGGFLS